MKPFDTKNDIFYGRDRHKQQLYLSTSKFNDSFLPPKKKLKNKEI